MRLMHRTWRIIVGVFAVVGALAVLAVCGGVAVWFIAQSREAQIADNTILTLDLTRSFPDAAPGRGLEQLVAPSRMSLIDALDTLRRAGDDPRIAGLVARIGDSGMGFAEVEELRDAIAAFRAKGKRAVAYSDTFGELSSGTRSYYLAAAFNEIWLQPMGMVGLMGLRAELPYFRGTLDRLGIVPDFAHREEFKDAANTLTETGMTGPEREELQALLGSISGRIVQDIATGRKIDPAALQALIDRAPLLTDEALKAHLIDHVGDRIDAIASFGAAPHLVSLRDYREAAGEAHQAGPTVALIYATGLLARGGGSGSLLGGGSGTDEVTRAFRLAREDKNVRAIVFRIDSPGGSAVAAESIWAAVERAREAGKPIIVSMGDVAGSGGYYIAAPADKIVAEPATLTGSIGVVAGKLVFSGLLQKLGANFAALQTGANAGFASALQDFSPAERARLNAVLDEIYAGFKERVAQGRKLDAQQVEAVAKGRVWSGADAQARKLVDTLGGFETALDLAKRAAGIPAGEDVTLKLYPPPESTFDAILARLTGGRDENGTDALLPAELLRAWHETSERLATMLAPPGALVMQPFLAR